MTTRHKVRPLLSPGSILHLSPAWILRLNYSAPFLQYESILLLINKKDRYRFFTKTIPIAAFCHAIPFIGQKCIYISKARFVFPKKWWIYVPNARLRMVTCPEFAIMCSFLNPLGIMRILKRWNINVWYFIPSGCFRKAEGKPHIIVNSGQKTSLLWK